MYVLTIANILSVAIGAVLNDRGAIFLSVGANMKWNQEKYFPRNDKPWSDKSNQISMETNTKVQNWEILPPKRQGRQRELIWLAVLEGFEWTWCEEEIITVIFKGTGGLIIVFRRVGGLKDTFWGQYFFRRRSQRVVALVSQSDTEPNNKSD